MHELPLQAFPRTNNSLANRTFSVLFGFCAQYGMVCLTWKSVVLPWIFTYNFTINIFMNVNQIDLSHEWTDLVVVFSTFVLPSLCCATNEKSLTSNKRFETIYSEQIV